MNGESGPLTTRLFEVNLKKAGQIGASVTEEDGMRSESVDPAVKPDLYTAEWSAMQAETFCAQGHVLVHVTKGGEPFRTTCTTCLSSWRVV